MDHWGTEAIRERLGRLDWAWAYLCIALSVGVVLVFLTPPFQNFDEAAHYYRAWSVAQGELTPPSSGFVTMPASAAKLEFAFPIVPLATGQVQVGVRDLLAQLGARISEDTATSTSFSAGYGPFGYLPQAVGFEVPRLLGRSPLAALYLGRLLNLACSVTLTFFAIRLLPFAKPVLFVIALMPIVLMQMASLSPDALLISGSLLFLALVLRCMQTESLIRMQMVALPATAAFLLNTKPGYATLSLVVLLLLPGQFRDVRRYAAVVGSTIVLTFMVAAALQLLAPGSDAVTELMLGSDSGVDVSAQIGHVLQHPVAFLAAVKDTFDGQGLYYGKIMVSVFAWGNLNATDTVVLLAALALAAVIAAPEAVRVAPWRRVVILGVAALTAVVVCLGLYVSFTPVGGSTIDGLQGRYFVPSFALTLFGLAGFPFGRRWVMPLTVVALVVLLMASTLLTITRHYY